MTQLFDTATYEDHTEAGTPGPQGDRHLRSLPAGEDLLPRSSQWRLDDDTIETGRRGIQAARQALQDAARSTSTKPRRTAA